MEKAAAPERRRLLGHGQLEVAQPVDKPKKAKAGKPKKKKLKKGFNL